MNREDIADLPSKERRKILKGQICEICLEKPARNILPSSSILCCCDRGNRCLNPKIEKLVCFGCGLPATKIMKPGPVCGIHVKGCPKFVEEYQIRKGQTYKDHLASDPEFRQERKEKYFKTLKEKHGVGSIFQLDSFKQKMIEKYGVENSSQSPEIREQMLKNSLEKWGTSHPLANLDQREKLKQIFIERYGVDNPAKSKELRKKNERAYTEKYGVHHPMMRPENQAKQRKTIMDRYGVKSVLSVPDIIKKARAIMIERYGVDNPMKSRELINAREARSVEKYGCNPASLEHIKNKIKDTNQRKYGVDYAISNPHIFRSKYFKNFYKNKELMLPSGRIITYQGYEDLAIKERLRYLKEDDILYNGEVSFEYIKNTGKRSTYFLDLYIKTENLGIEVKSSYTFMSDLYKDFLIPKITGAFNGGTVVDVEVWDKQLNEKITFSLDKLKKFKKSYPDLNIQTNYISIKELLAIL